MLDKNMRTKTDENKYKRKEAMGNGASISRVYSARRIHFVSNELLSVLFKKFIIFFSNSST